MSTSTSMDDYEVDFMELLGTGSYGTVYKGKKRTSGSPIAVKRSKLNDDGAPSRTTVREISLLKLLSDDPHFVKLLHAETDKDGEVMNIVMEFVDTNVAQEYDPDAVITIPELKDLMFQLCKGLAVSHSREIMHRDIKPANLLLDKNKRLKIGDLGSSRKSEVSTKEYTPLVGTIWYKAPEILLKASTYTVAVDMWSAGCIFAELAKGENIFESLTPDLKDQVKQIFRILGTPDDNIWPVISSQPEADMREYDDPYEKKSFKSLFPRLDKNGRNLLKGMLRIDPAQRVTAKDAMNHPYFDVVDKNNL